MSRFEPADIDQVRERADITAVIGDHVRLKQAGRSHKGLCPFHQEKTPSFTVDRDKGVYYCHGCGAGGSVFTFVQEIEGLSFPEAVEQLAERYGVELRRTGGGERRTSPRARLQALHEAAVEHYREALNDADAAPVREYLAERGISSETVERYRIGFGGWRRDALIRSLVAKGFTTEELDAASLATRDQRGPRDMFAGRLLFPIFDPSDRPVGFGGRVLPEAYRRRYAPEHPKYLNSRETVLFKKKRILYGANWARGDVVRARRLVLVEGYTDVIALHGAGVGEAVATCGTSLTEDHMKEISTRFGDVRVIMCLDADAAGQAAMSRDRTEELAETFSPGEETRGGWLPVGRGWLPEVYVANLPDGRDPAEFAAEAGAEGLEALFDAAVPLAEFLLRRAIGGEDPSTPNGRARAVHKGAEVLAQIGDSLLRHEYALWLGGQVGVDAYEVTKAVDAHTKEARGGTRATPSNEHRPAVPLTGHQRVERESLRVLVTVREAFENPDLVPEEDDFTHPLHRAMYRLIEQERASEGRVDVGRLTARIQEPELQRSLSGLAVGEPLGPEVAVETLQRLKESALGRCIQERKERLRSLDAERDAEAYDALFDELLTLEKQRRALLSGTPA